MPLRSTERIVVSSSSWIVSYCALRLRRRYYHDELGVNSRLDELQAATLVVKLPHLKAWNQRRAHLASIYNQSLQNCPGLVTPTVSLAGGKPDGAKNNVQHVYHQYTVRVLAPDRTLTLENSNRDRLIAQLTERGIGSMCYYPVPLHTQTAFQYLGYKMGQFPISEQLSREVLSLPMYPELTDEQVAVVGKTIVELLSEAAASKTATFAPATVLAAAVPVTPPATPSVAPLA